MDDLKEKILHLKEADFETTALQVFRLQALQNPVYKQYLNFLNIDRESVNAINQIPFLPIEFFKTQKITCDGNQRKVIFESSGTTGGNTSRHYIHDTEFYQKVAIREFEWHYGKLEQYQILALLPSYLERGNSSLVYMVDAFIKSAGGASGFFLKDQDELYQKLDTLYRSGEKVILWGVTFALLDFAERFPGEFPELIVMETGGMKGRRKEMVRAEVHRFIKTQLGVPAVHSEYGMTELLSQFYSQGDGVFEPSHTARIVLRDLTDPLTQVGHHRNGGINVIDLANLYSCSFIATQDIGRLFPKGRFEVLGRFDHADVRGCNLLVN